VISAVVVGSRGRRNVTGPQLQQLFGLMSTYMSFTTLTTKGTSKKVSRPVSSSSSSGSGSGGASTGGSSPFSRTVVAPGGSVSSGGAGFATAMRRSVSIVPEISGSLYPAGPIRVQMRRGTRWVTVARTRTSSRGSYSVRVPRAGRYRVVSGGFAGPAVSVL
jgi:hypothetical protein